MKVFDGELTPAEVTELYNETHPCSTSWPQLLAYYRMEDASWSGASGEVKDTSGNNYHGQAIGSPLPTPNVSTTPALSGNPGTCGYATFPGPWANGGAVAATLPTVATDEGDKTSVSFWMNWNGSDGRMPIGWSSAATNKYYDLYLVGNTFGFNTGCGDVYGISSSASLVNSWHHVVAVFTNRSVKANKLYIDGNLQNLSQVLPGAGPCLNRAYVTQNFRISGWAGDNEYRFQGAIDEVKVFKGELTKDQVDQLRVETHTCGAFHHLRVESPGPGYQCIRRPVTFKACANAACSTLYTGGVTFNLWNGHGGFYAVPTGGTPLPNTSSGATVTIGSSGSVTLYIEPSSGLGSFALMPTISPAPSNGVQFYCPNYSTSACNLGMTSPLIGTWFPCPGKLNACDDYATTQCKSAFSRLYTRLPAASSAFTLAALDSSGNNLTILSGPLTVDLIATNNPTPTLDANGCFTPDATSTPVTVTFSNQTHVPSATLNLPSGVWRNVRVRLTCSAATCPPSGLTRCSSDNFAIRPQAFNITFSSPNADSTGTSPTATPVYKAGTVPFSLTVTPSVPYTSTATIDPGMLEAHSGAAQAGGVLPTSIPISGSSGVASLTYSEVGYFRFKSGAIRDATWTQVDQPNDCHTNSHANTPTGGKIGCNVANQSDSVFFGRFIPDHFTLTSPGTLNHVCGSGPSAFNYLGQNPVSVANFKFTAQNGANATTMNYQGSYAKLTTASWSNFLFTTSPALPTGVALTAGGTPTTSCTLGDCSTTASFAFSRPANPVAEQLLQIKAQPKDSDNVTAFSAAAIHSGNVRLRYGRLVLANAHGSEKANLTMPFEAQYWTGTAWVTNTLDNCTDITSSLVFVKNPMTLPSPSSSGTLVAGKGTLTFPAANPLGTVNVCANIGSDPDNSIASCRNGTSYPWLQGSWDADSQYNDNPSAVATFGRARQQTPIIFRREQF